MPTNCCAVGCTNNLSKGIKTYSLPMGKDDQQRLQKWILRIKRQNNYNHKTARLCAEHFEMDQFEPNIPGKLKRTAVPTIFSHRAKPKQRMPPKKRAAVEKNISLPSSSFIQLDHQHSHPANPEGEISLDELPTGVPDITNQSSNQEDHSACEEKIVRLKAQLNAERKKLCQLRKEHENLKSKVCTLFNPEQLRVLELGGTNSTLKWSDETVKKALQLYFSCGANGYDVLLAQGFPFPSDRTLRRRLETVPFS